MNHNKFLYSLINTLYCKLLHKQSYSFRSNLSCNFRHIQSTNHLLLRNIQNHRHLHMMCSNFLNRKSSQKSKKNTQPTEETRAPITEDGQYSSKEDVAEYLHLFGHLPDNYLTKNEAQDLGWVASKGNLWKVAPGMSIGGDRFGNREGLLPTKKGRKYYECDIDFDGTYRNAKRIVFSNDGLIYYTEDHYESFELLYGEES